MPKGNVPAPKVVAKATQPKEEKKTQAALPKKAAKEQLKAKQQAPKVVEEESDEEEEIVKAPVKNVKAPQQKKAEKKPAVVEEEDDEEEDEDFEGEVIEEENSEDEEEEVEEDDEDEDEMEEEDDSEDDDEDNDDDDVEGDDDIYIPKKKAKVNEEKEKVTKGHERSQNNAPGKKVDTEEKLIQAEKGKKNNKADRFSKQQKDIEAPQRGILYIGHLPYGFVEEGIKEYFSQYGEILNIHLARSKKTARSRGFAFVEFKFKEVAKIAAESMNGYMLYGKKMTCRVLEDDEGVKVRTKKFKYIPYNKIFIAEKNREKEPKELRKEIKNLLKNEEKKRQKLKELNINYEFPGFKSLVSKAQGSK